MATKKRKKKKSAAPKKGAGSASKAAKRAVKKRASKKSAKKKAVAKKKGLKRAAARKTTGVRLKETLKKRQGRGARAFSSDALEPRSGEQAGDLQGLSRVEGADSESVDELIEEGNAFEAGVVTGVEEAEKHEDREVRTREVPEDDVPGEYLDKD